MRRLLLIAFLALTIAAVALGARLALGGSAAPTATPGILDNYCPTQASGGAPRCLPGAPPLRSSPVVPATVVRP